MLSLFVLFFLFVLAGALEFAIARRKGLHPDSPRALWRLARNKEPAPGVAAERSDVALIFMMAAFMGMAAWERFIRILFERPQPQASLLAGSFLALLYFALRVRAFKHEANLARLTREEAWIFIGACFLIAWTFVGVPLGLLAAFRSRHLTSRRLLAWR